MPSKIIESYPCEAVIGPVRLSYPHLFVKYSGIPGAEEKYSASFLVPKTDGLTVKVIKSAIQAATTKGLAEKWGNKIPANLNSPLKDGDLKMLKDREGRELGPDPAYAGCWYLEAKSAKTIAVYDQSQGPRVKLDEDQTDQVYGGCYVYADLVVAPYALNAANRGLTVYLQQISKVADGEPLGGRLSADDAFGDIPGTPGTHLDDLLL